MSLTWDAISSGSTWTPARKIKHTIDLGRSWAIRLTPDYDFHNKLKVADSVGMRIKIGDASLRAVSQKDDTTKIVDALRKMHQLWNEHYGIAWELCKYMFTVLGPNIANKPVGIKISHPERDDIRIYVREFLRYVAMPDVQEINIDHVHSVGHPQGHQRSFYSEENQTIYLRDSINRPLIWHELGHLLEHKTPGASEVSLAYQDYRAGNQKPVKMNDVQSPYHRPDEMTRPDKFIEPYFGKSYDDGTEVNSMALQLMTSAPAALYEKDIETFYFTLGIVKAARANGFPWK